MTFKNYILNRIISCPKSIVQITEEFSCFLFHNIYILLKYNWLNFQVHSKVIQLYIYTCYLKIIFPMSWLGEGDSIARGNVENVEWLSDAASRISGLAEFTPTSFPRDHWVWTSPLSVWGWGSLQQFGHCLLLPWVSQGRYIFCFKFFVVFPLGCVHYVNPSVNLQNFSERNWLAKIKLSQCTILKKKN